MSTAVMAKPLRWSSARDCARKAVYEATEAPARERSTREDRTMHRGRTLGREYVVMFATASGKRIWVDSGPDYWVPPDLRADSSETAGVIAEQTVTWALGTGHADAYVLETGTIVEVLSSAHASDEMIQSKLLQAVGYCEHFEQARNVCLVVLNPVDLSETRTVVVKTSSAYAALVDEMCDRLAELAEWKITGRHPKRVCRKPSEARGHFCLYAETCFEDWQAPPIEEIAADENLLEAARTFVEAKTAQAQSEREAKAWESRKKEAQAVLEQAELPNGMTVAIGGVHVTRSQVTRRPTFEWAKAEAAGRFDPEGLSEFFKAGAEYSTFKAERLEPEDFGDEAPF